MCSHKLAGIAAGLTAFGLRVIKNTGKALYLAGSRLKSTGHRTAVNTTIHGIRDAYRGNWISRLFFIIVFVCCLIAMVFQLKGIFHGYRTEAVGTRVTATGAFNADEIPSVHYCNKNWLPMLEPLTHFNYSDPAVPDGRRYKECVDWSIPIERDGTMFANHGPDDCNQYVEYWKHMLKQELVNSILSPPEHEASGWLHRKNRPRLYYVSYENTGTELQIRWYYAKKFASDIINQHVGKLLNTLWLDQSSLRESVREDIQNVTFGDVRVGSVGDVIAGKKNWTVYYNATSSIMANEIVGVWQLHHLESIFDDFNFRHSIDSDVRSQSYKLLAEMELRESIWEDRLFKRTIPHEQFSLSLDGLCWEHPLRTHPQTANEIGGNRHFVIHLGGMAHRMRKLIERISAVQWSEVNWNAQDETKGLVKISLMAVLNFASAIDKHYHTHIAVSRKAEPNMYFKQKVRVDSNSQVVTLKYWKKTNIRLNRAVWPCKPAPWTELDQAHCNQNGMRYNTDHCNTYLPASGNYPETQIGRDTCIYDTTGVFKDLFFAVDPEARVKFLPSHKAYNTTNRRWRSDVVANLTESNRDCPQPCTRTEFVYQTSYPFPTKTDVEMCHRALAYLLTPIAYTGKTQHSLNSYHWFHYASAVITEQFGQDTPFCSVIEYEHMESLGQATEEYFLYGLPDVAANLGGTLGLWIGASVISIVQMVYLCCLKNLFKGTWRKMRFRRGSIAPASTRTDRIPPV